MKNHIAQRKTLINKNITKVFDFFSKAENLDLLTPPHLGFKIISKLPLEMKVGTLIDYRLKLNGIPFRWQSIISRWDPPYLFEDKQLTGPYKVWIHEHKFEDKDGSTLMTDTIEYLSPGGIFEFIPHALFVKKKLSEILDYREKTLNEIFSKEVNPLEVKPFINLT
ncbi:MAG: SRPBCC family protein [Ignavibacteria bacterium]